MFAAFSNWAGVRASSSGKASRMPIGRSSLVTAEVSCAKAREDRVGAGHNDLWTRLRRSTGQNIFDHKSVDSVVWDRAVVAWAPVQWEPHGEWPTHERAEGHSRYGRSPLSQLRERTASVCPDPMVARQ